MKRPTPAETESTSPGRPVRFGETQASVLLDLVRGLAALIVVAEHCRNLFFVDFGELPRLRLLWAPFYLVTAAGHQAVVIFFVLSGYLISGSIFRSLRSGSWSWRSYLTHRLVRLWVVVLPGLLFCAACDTLGLWLQRAPRLYAGLGSNHMTPNVLVTRTLPIFWSNVFFLQGIRMPMFGSDGALWSLAVEFWFYLLFPLGLLSLSRGSVLKRVLYACGFALIAWFVGVPVMISFPIWLLGVLLQLCPVKPVSVALRSGAAVLYAALLFFLARFRGLQGITSDAVLAVATFAFLWLLLSARGRAPETSRAVRWSRFLARGSFTLYVVHTPLLTLLASVLARDTRWVPGVRSLTVAGAALCATLLAAYALASITEFRTDQLRRRLEGMLGFGQ